MTVSCLNENILDHVRYEYDASYSYTNVYIPDTYTAQNTEQAGPCVSKKNMMTTSDSNCPCDFEC